jgi:hypothetical protein
VAIGARVFEGIIQQVGDDPFDGRGVYYDQRQIGGNVHIDGPSVEEPAHSVHTASNQSQRSRSDALRRSGASLRGLRMLHELVDELGQAVGVTLDLGQKLTPGALVPLDVWSAECAYESLDVAQRQTQLVRRRAQHLD